MSSNPQPPLWAYWLRFLRLWVGHIETSSFLLLYPAISLGSTILLLLRSPAISLGFTILLLLLRSPAISLGFTILLLLLRSPAISLGFTILLLLLRSPTISLGFTILLFFCVPQLYLWASPFLGEIFAYVTVFLIQSLR